MIEEINQMMGGINPSHEIPSLWFEIFKMHYILHTVSVNKPAEITKKTLDNAVEFAAEQVRKKFPNIKMEILKNKPQEVSNISND